MSRDRRGGVGRSRLPRFMLELEPDVVVMDLAMPGMGGLEALRRMRARHPQARVLTLSAHDDPMHARRGLAGGRARLSVQAQRPRGAARKR